MKEVVKENLELLAEYEVDDIDTKYQVKSRRTYPKKCLHKSWDYWMDRLHHNETMRLVAGLYTEHLIWHVWVEFVDEKGREVVFDGVLQRFYDKDGYYQKYQIIVDREYTLEDMKEIGVEDFFDEIIKSCSKLASKIITEKFS
jgi:hypothetical protein